MNRIKNLRENHKMTQERLGELLNVQKAAISKYENELVPLTDDTLLKLSEIFDVSTDYILGAEPKNFVTEIENDDKTVEWVKGFRSLKNDKDKEKVLEIFDMITENMDKYQD